MSALSVPEDGLFLLRNPDRGSASNPALPFQVMRLSLAQKATEELLKSFQNKEKISIRFGKRVTVQHGKKSHPVFAFPELIPSELYQHSTDEDNTFYFSGKLSHRIETQKAQTDTAKTDEALANLENSLKSYEEQKASNEARFVTDKDELRHLSEASQKGKGSQTQASAIRKDRLLNTIGRSTPSSPFLGAALSPAIGPTSAGRPVSASISKDQIRLNAIKIPFLHLLAVKPSTPKVLADTIHATREDCEKLLHKYGKNVVEANGKQELKDKAYRELDLWKFPYPDGTDRQSAIDRTISAFDRMRISTSDPIWETLLAVRERGKGKGLELSRLKIGQAGLNGPTPKAVSSQGGPHSVTDTDTDHGKPADKAKGSTTKNKPRARTDEGLEKNPALRKEATKQLKEVNGKDSAKREKRKAQPNAKFKSSEVIEDSDEELQNVETSIKDTTKSKKGSNTKVKSSTTNRSSANSTATPSTKPPTSSSKPTPKSGNSLLPNSALTQPRAESTTNKASPRSRTDSSPQKPSLLASSPPTNATDLDNSQSSKANSLSSAMSSPAMSPRHNGGHKATASSNPLERRHPSTTLKRKASDQPSSAPKRQQLNGNHVARTTTNGITKAHRDSKNQNIANTASSSQRSRAPSSSSASTATTTSSLSAIAAASKPLSTQQSELQLKSKSRRFKIQYAQYQALHAKIMAVPEGERDAEEVRVLRKMHVRIGELKREIWEGWERDRAREGVKRKG
jgi:RNA polymerase II elongation factor ELL